MNLDLALLVRATGGSVLRNHGTELVRDSLHAGDLAHAFGSVVIDSRQVQPGDLFVALPGERTDGHEYVAQALAAGAAGAIVATTCDRAIVGTALAAGRVGAMLIEVSDPLTALHQLATEWRRSLSASVVGITGSIGKTTTKDIIAALIEQSWPTLRTVGNLNTEIGLPLMLLQLEMRHRAAVLEMGMYVPGDIALLARIAEPQIGVVTNVAPVHLERAGSIERIARAKSELVAALPPDGLAVLNGDDPWTRAMAHTSSTARTVLFGEAPDCDLRADDVQAHGLTGISFNLFADGERHRVATNVAGKHNVGAFLAACAVARELGLSWEAILAAVPAVRLDSRQRILISGTELVIIDDSYNAAPLSVKAALSLLQSAPGQRIAVLGDMLELGPDECAAHHDIGATAAEIVDWLVVRGPRACWIAEGARGAGLRPERIVTCETNVEAASVVKNIMSSRVPVLSATPTPRMQRPTPEDTQESGWAVLVKGSRGMKMEEIVERLQGKS